VLLASEDVVYGYFFSLSYTVGGLREADYIYIKEIRLHKARPLERTDSIVVMSRVGATVG
jgi:hypothetical protein